MYKKSINYFVIAAVTILTLFSSTACSKDDDNDVSSNSIIGDWQCTRSIGWYKENGKIVDEWNEYYPDADLSFKKGGTVRLGDDYDYVWGTYTYKNWKLSLMFEDGDNLTCDCKITNNKMVLTYHETYTYNGKKM